MFLSACKKVVCAILQSIKCAVAHYDTVHSLIYKYFIAKREPSSEPSAGCNLFAGGGSSLEADAAD